MSKVAKGVILKSTDGDKFIWQERFKWENDHLDEFNGRIYRKNAEKVQKPKQKYRKSAEWE